MRTGIVVASICVAWAETVTFATWNVLSIPKCSEKANGFPYFDKDALKLHNSLSCGEKADQHDFDIGTKNELQKKLDLKSCHGTWISGQVKQLFTANSIDILLVQEIDYFHFKGLERIIGDTFQMTPLTLPTLKAAEQELSESLQKDMPKDLPFVVWDKSKISRIECFRAQGWATGVGECAYTTPSKSRRRFIGMHAGGNEGFNEVEAGKIGKRTNIDVVLGDFNLHTLATATAAVQTIEPDLKVATPAGEGSATVYRFVHPARKLFQAFDNDWRKGIDKDTGVTKHPFTCPDVLTKIVAKVTNGQTEYVIPESFKVFELKPKSVKTYIDMCNALKQLGEGSASTEENNPPKEDKLVLELNKLDRIGSTGIDYKFDWTKFPAALELKADLGMTKKAATFVSMDVKQEDFIAYNQNRFKKPSALVIVKEDVLRPRAERNRKMKDSFDMEHFPIKDMASDHLPVVLHLEQILAKKAGTFEVIAPKSEATPEQKEKRWKALDRILKYDLTRKERKRVLEQVDNGQLDVRQALMAGHVAHKKAEEKTCWQIIKGWFTTNKPSKEKAKDNEAKIKELSQDNEAKIKELSQDNEAKIKELSQAKSASIRRKLGGMAPTMGKLLKALKRMSQRMKKGERAA